MVEMPAVRTSSLAPERYAPGGLWDDGGQVAPGGVGEAVGAVALEGFLDLVAGADRADGGVAGAGHDAHLAVRVRAAGCLRRISGWATV